MSTSDWPPPRPSLALTSPPLLPYARFGILSHQLTYMFLLRTLYTNANDKLLKVFNALFYPPASALPVVMTLKEWHTMWAVRPLYRFSEEEVWEEIESLSFRRDWICYGAPGEAGEEVVEGVVCRKSSCCRWEDVLDYVERMAGGVGVELLRR